MSAPDPLLAEVETTFASFSPLLAHTLSLQTQLLSRSVLLPAPTAQTYVTMQAKVGDLISYFAVVKRQVEQRSLSPKALKRVLHKLIRMCREAADSGKAMLSAAEGMDRDEEDGETTAQD